MAELKRTVRLCISEGDSFDDASRADAVNGFAGHPPMRGLGRYYEVEVCVAGEPDAATGYLMNIKEIDGAVRGVVAPVLARACAEEPGVDPGVVLGRAIGALDGALGGIVSWVRLRLTPYYSVAMMKDAQDKVVIRQRFEFSAAHRLHVPSLDEAENRRVFGKCNNPSGHGHNYEVEPAVEVAVDGGGAAFGLADVERVTDREIIERFDHKHLNTDTDEFCPERGGVNPSVENIARVCFGILSPAIERESGGAARLKRMTVWETGKTSSTYGG